MCSKSDFVNQLNQPLNYPLYKHRLMWKNNESHWRGFLVAVTPLAGNTPSAGVWMETTKSRTILRRHVCGLDFQRHSSFSFHWASPSA